LDALELRMRSLFAQPDPQAGEQLQIMTIHKAKGLEFDTVIVPGLGREAARDDKPLLLWTQLPGLDGASVSSRELLVSPVESAEEDRDPIYDYLRHLDRARGLHESMRLLYVAATRARERLHLLGQVAVKEDEALKPRTGSLLALLWPTVAPVFQRAYDEGAAVDAPTPAAPGGGAILRLPRDWSSPSTAAASATRDSEGDEPIRFGWVGDALRHAGTVAHAWLARIVEEGVEDWSAAKVASRGPAIQAALEALGVPPTEMGDAARHVSDALVQTLGDVRGRWLLRRREIDACELEIAVPMDGVVQHAVIDRAFVEDGVRWIVDYKTSTHEGGDLEGFLDKEVARYAAQLARYARMFQQFEDRPVRVGLYFPLLGAWRDWE
jgi:ATP-dependent exoDNAse (exonuclease V) beta subunit